MTLYLRNEKGRNLLDLEVWVKTEDAYSFVELRSAVNITNYSELLLDNIPKANKIIHDFDSLSELRGWLWERYFMTGENDGSQIDDVIDKVKKILNKVAKDYNLALIED
jgi:hypothetical protein